MTTPRHPTRGPGLALLVPVITLLFFCADVALRAVPLDAFAFRAWESMVSPEGGPKARFWANARYENNRAYGDLAALGNRPDLRRLHRETFTTDAHGFRNPPGLLASGPPEIVLFGDSLGVGSGVTDEQVLSAALARLTGRRVYNAAGPTLSASNVREVLNEIRMVRGIVLIQELDRRSEPLPVSRAGALRFLFMAQLIQSRMRLLSVAVKKYLENDVLLPNSYRDNATVLELRNGVPMLFYPMDLGGAPAHAADKRYLTYLISIAKKIQTENLRVVFVLVPTKYGVYGPLLLRNPERATEKLGMRLEWLERALRASGVEAVNVTADLQLAAAVRLEKDKYVWFLDDTHWNAAGIRVTAERVTRYLGAPR